ncbi:MAG: hypothetical protein LBD55_10805 [Treponema sp.]|nr:hypothetical protein [Treponema sp.]
MNGQRISGGTFLIPCRIVWCREQSTHAAWGSNVCGHGALALGNKGETAVETPAMGKSRNLEEQAGQPDQAPSPGKNL